MNWCRALFILVLVVFASCPIVGEEPKDEVGATWEKLGEAFIGKRGKVASELVTASSLKVYEQLRDTALTADEATVRKLPVSRKKLVLAMRHLLKKDELTKMDGKSVFAYLIEQEIADQSWLLLFKLGDPVVSNDTARAPLQARNPNHLQGKLKEVNFEFKRDGGKWRMELQSIFKIEDLVSERLFMESGMKEDDAIIKVLEKHSGRKVSPDIWKPLAAASGQ